MKLETWAIALAAVVLIAILLDERASSSTSYATGIAGNGTLFEHSGLSLASRNKDFIVSLTFTAVSKGKLMGPARVIQKSHYLETA